MEMRAEYIRLRNIRIYRNMPKTDIETKERLNVLNEHLILLEESVIERCKEQYLIMIEKQKNNDVFLSEFEINVEFDFSGPYMEDALNSCSDYGFSNEMVTQLDGIDGIEIALDRSPLQNWKPSNSFSIKDECWLYFMLFNHCHLNVNAILSITGLGADVKVKMINRTEYLNNVWIKQNKYRDHEAI
ncbi:MAG: hypothetical protein GZ094_02730 [Mariniphaga sp.]|nr:hypothetical protein [Mariniphaga sp.]